MLGGVKSAAGEIQFKNPDQCWPAWAVMSSGACAGRAKKHPSTADLAGKLG